MKLCRQNHPFRVRATERSCVMLDSVAIPAFVLENPETCVLDLANPKPKLIVALVEAIEAAIKANPVLGPLKVTTGWNEITPTIAIDLLRRNRPGINRKVDPATVFYYAAQMKCGEWKATGQPFLIDRNGFMLDAQHRALAVIISGATIRSYVVTEIDPIPNMFAYIDNSRPRTAATALATAGFNGTSSTIAKVLILAESVRLGVFNRGGAAKYPRQTPAQMLALVAKYPHAKEACRSAASDWKHVVDYLGATKKDIVAYLGMQITELYDFD